VAMLLRRLAPLTVLTAALALSVGACGGGKGDGPTTDPPQGDVAIAGIEMAYLPGSFTLPNGVWHLVFTNRGHVQHELTVERKGEPIARTSAGPGQTVDLVVRFRKGAYVFACHEPGHFEAGMHANVAVG
jgi:plastocyanin